MGLKRLIDLARRSSGQELMEYAITVPIFLLIVFGIFDLGRVVYFASALQNAAREGARYGVVNPHDTPNVISRVKQRSLGLNKNDISVSVTWNCPTVLVDVDYIFRPITPIIGRLFPGGNVNISLSSELQRERYLFQTGQPDEFCPPTG